MAEVRQIKNLIERDWTPSISGRSTDVPNPDDDEIVWTLEKEKRNARLKHQDVGYVVTGADTNYTPQGLGWQHQSIDTAVVIEYRVRTRQIEGCHNNGYDRLFGTPNGSDGVAAPDRHAGIVGETRRIIEDNRKRTGGWDRIGTNQAGESLQVRDLADLGGKNYWRADVWIPMDTIASEIDTST